MNLSRDTVFLITAAVLGLAAGMFLGFTSGDAGANYCKQIESQVEANQSFNGTITCRPPGVYSVDVADQIENRTELRCVCRKAYEGREQYFAITVAQAR